MQRSFLHLQANLNAGNRCLLLLCVLCGCSGSTGDASSLSEGERREIQSAVINRFNGMIKYSEAGELENVLKYFDASADGSYVDGATRYASFQDMSDTWRATWQVQKQDYGVPDTKIVILSSDFVMVTATSTLSTTNRSSVVFRPRPWSFTTVWHRKDAQWFIYSFHQFSGDLVKVEPDPD
jgi:hypothetical protein